jgi:hypothetical protein
MEPHELQAWANAQVAFPGWIEYVLPTSTTFLHAEELLRGRFNNTIFANKVWR